VSHRPEPPEVQGPSREAARDFGYSSGLIRLGRLDSGVALLRGPGPVRVTIERAGW